MSQTETTQPQEQRDEELKDRELTEVAGGLNPQPLPPLIMPHH